MDFTHPIITKSAQETANVGRDLALYLIGRGDVPRLLCLHGNLGAGKTTFTQGFARGLGITSRLLSPTFIIVRRYDIPGEENQLYHIDLYRLNTPGQMDELGLEEIFSDPSAYVIIEWAERLKELPKKRIDIWFKVIDDETHEITIKNI